ncbi:hypothetical protein [Cupriavidus pauculus]|uniref:hypothetical protein n=1 Tax=Cupriavidus pauculus TaxID=82633 RepID=UPI00124529B8|nr:hypothetical protein [Cupriavidus pauculus]KAB0601097.1 hypothetical protein F7R19_18730 [Cupriavidus pauculus]UAL02032.1 hypothetical protein K8O84_24825 [Cupriavidus pauculus]
MSNVESVAAELRSSGMELVTALQTTKEIKRQAFERLDQASRELARLLKGSEQLPRQIVNDLYVTAKILENEASYSRDAVLVAQMASALYMTFDLILLGESHEDRRLGVPRAR